MIAKVFKSGNSMAIRIPKGINLSEINEFEIKQIGLSLLLNPIKNKNQWGAFFEALDEFAEKIEIPHDEVPQERNFGKIFT
ncbi:hypothetical protein CQA49_06715 [Helicobacter sp. MIT 00-7814]|uniref:antitoxin n=1 Tax=unclassified Helicobacter TaxID=2593540 RepID=UPI000E1FAC81|nr:MULTISPECIES: hypothetical protein [unclassified Helicobacter]RDU53335.1 hypothetical protein CQA49_06715 [Helicobacter sp. MIT 00-7814]RDU54156.1 hypothetical protein CQA37_05955 [Helicobacter sp. MIT 99-10781]